MGRSAALRPVAARGDMTPFSLFALLSMTAFLLEMVEKWEYPGFTLLSFLIVTIIVFTRVTHIKLLFFLYDFTLLGLLTH